MKLKQLYIRNIASIEKADIDFENGLKDAVTGMPASIFLISGDTGAGKSVILDGISMALYKKTPRLADVANSQRNEYTDSEGESIRVASIEQYTRLGISHKDESYSEVVFEGNDGQTYHARLTLGMQLGNTDKTTGLRPLKHRKPKWEMKVGNGDWTNDSVEQTILNAVGLDFQQFGRMAMLAQGQFANFLTGDKKEREAILEQLTNTQHFSAYGDAIQSLYKNAKDALAHVQTQYDTEKPHTLTDEEVEQITNEQKITQQWIDIYNKTLKTLEEREKHIHSVLTNDGVRAEAKQKKQQLGTLMASDEYTHYKTLTADWDSTSEQRQKLTELLKAKCDEAQAKSELARLQETFNMLSADIADRQVKTKAQADTIQHLQSWISQRSQYESLFKKAGEADLKMGQYLEMIKKSNELNTLLETERSKTAALKKEEKNAAAVAQAAARNVNAQQNEIDRLNQQRQSLKPQEVNDKLKQQNERKQQLIDLGASISNLKPMKEELLRLQCEIQEEEKQLSLLKEAGDKTNANYQQQKQEADAATKRLTTMEMSLDLKIKELRHRLHEEHSECCPLCGQHIQKIALDDEFKDMLTPLEIEQKKAAGALKNAEEKRDKVLGELKQLDGSHKSKLKQQKTTEQKIAQAQQAINEKANKAGLSIGNDLGQQIDIALQTLSISIDALETTQREAESIQVSINELLQTKKSVDKEKDEADKHLINAENNVKSNTKTIEQLESSQIELVKGSETLKTDIDSMLKGYCDAWTTDSDKLRKQLNNEAETFAKQQKALADNMANQEKANALTDSLQSIQHSILQACPEWDGKPSPEAYNCGDIHTEWTNLLRRVTSLVSKIKECGIIIRQSSEMLSSFYEQSGKTQQTLQELMNQERKVEGARHMLNDLHAQLRSRNDAIDEAERQIKTAMAALGIHDNSELPDLQQLEEQKVATNALRDEALAKMAQAKGRLHTHQENIKHLKEIEEQLQQARQRYARWDRLNCIFGGSRFRTLVQSYILRPLLNNANIYLEQITDRYHLTCSDENEQLSILVLDRYNKDQVRSVTVLSGGERFMISLALSLALSSLNRPYMNVNILFIDEGFGTLDEHSLDSVMTTLEKLQEIAGQTNRRVGIISHREELEERIPVKIQVVKKGEGRSRIEVKTE